MLKAGANTCPITEPIVVESDTHVPLLVSVSEVHFALEIHVALHEPFTDKCRKGDFEQLAKVPLYCFRFSFVEREDISPDIVMAYVGVKHAKGAQNASEAWNINLPSAKCATDGSTVQTASASRRD